MQALGAAQPLALSDLSKSYCDIRLIAMVYACMSLPSYLTFARNRRQW
jgi:hypothetical protein